MKLLFVKSNNKLIAMCNGKFYFPDTRGNIKEEGVYECNVSIDKESYAFVTGTKIETITPNENIIKRYFYESIPVITKNIGKDIILFIKENNMMNVMYANCDGELNYIITYSMKRKYDDNIYDYEKL